MLIGEVGPVQPPPAVPGQVEASRLGVVADLAAGRGVAKLAAQQPLGPGDRGRAVPFPGSEQDGDVDRPGGGGVDGGREQVGQPRSQPHAEEHGPGWVESLQGGDIATGSGDIDQRRAVIGDQCGHGRVFHPGGGQT